MREVKNIDELKHMQEVTPDSEIFKNREFCLHKEDKDTVEVSLEYRENLPPQGEDGHSWMSYEHTKLGNPECVMNREDFVRFEKHAHSDMRHPQEPCKFHVLCGREGEDEKRQILAFCKA